MHHSTHIRAFCDWLTVSAPYDRSGGLDHALLDALAPVLPQPREGVPGKYDVGGRGGSFDYRRNGPIMVAQFSGGALESMRAARCFDTVLSVFAHEYPDHRVTRLDAAHDVYGSPAAPVVLTLFARYGEFGVHVGKRPLPVRRITAFGNAGVETGTVYAGTGSSRVKVRVYDKREERFANAGLLVEDWLRYELQVRGGEHGVAVSLRDVQDPTPLFWHFMSPVFVRPPAGAHVPSWESARPVGFVLEPRSPVDPSDRLRRHVERGAADELVRQAMACGPGGLSLLNNLLAERLKAELRAAQPASAACQEGT